MLTQQTDTIAIAKLKWWLIVIVCIVLEANTCDVEGYYWRDFTGDVPIEAYPGGKAANGDPVYIGQTFFRFLMLPGKIYKYDTTAYFYYKTFRAVKNNVKILCSVHPKKLKWLPTNNQELENIDEDLVKAGFDRNYTYYIGRQTWLNETVVGWIPFHNKTAKRVLKFETEKTLHTNPYFEVLIYNKTAKE